MSKPPEGLCNVCQLKVAQSATHFQPLLAVGIALRDSHAECLRGFLRSADADLKKRLASPTHSKRFMHLALEYSQPVYEFVGLLLAVGVKPCLLHEFVARGQHGCVRMLLLARAPVDELDSHGRTPLRVAVQNLRIECAHELLDAGASRALGKTKEDGPILDPFLQARERCLEAARLTAGLLRRRVRVAGWFPLPLFLVQRIAALVRHSRRDAECWTRRKALHSFCSQ